MSPDEITSRRAVLGATAVTLTGAGVVYGASKLGSSKAGGPEGVNLRASDQTITLAETETRTVSIDLTGNPIMGSEDAPATAYYWTDYQCPFCRRLEQETFPKLLEEQIRPGTLKVVFLQFPYLSDGSHTAAAMDKCVWRQVRDTAPGRYWDWHAAVFDNQGKKGSGWASEENLLSITEDVDGVDAAAVEACLSQSETPVSEVVDADRSLGRQLGIRGTPSFVMRNPETGTMGRLVGAQPYDRFETAIERIQEA